MPDWLLVISLIVIGFILLLIEILIIPGFGFIGVLGLFALGFGSYLAYTKLSIALGLVTTVGSLAIIVLALKFFPKTAAWRRLRLEGAETKEEGFGSASVELIRLIDKQGVTLTPLRPSGKAIIEGKKVDVVTEGIFVPKDTKVKVVRVEGNRVVVRSS